MVRLLPLYRGLSLNIKFTYMGTLAQLGNQLDSFNSQPCGEGLERLVTSAGNTVFFRSPAEKTAYLLSPAGQSGFAVTNGATQSVQNTGSYNDNTP